MQKGNKMWSNNWGRWKQHFNLNHFNINHFHNAWLEIQLILNISQTYFFVFNWKANKKALGVSTKKTKKSLKL